MNANVRLGKIWNIPIGLNYSWFLVFALVTWSLAAGIFPASAPGLNVIAYLVLGLIASVLFFSSVLAHELGHAYLARRNDVPVRAITLFFFGGVAEITREPKSAGAEFRIAIAGPVVSLALGALFGVVYLLGQGNPMIAVPALWLARINVILALFNMIPGFPLDGGRVFRAIVWRLKGDAYSSTKIAAGLSHIIALGFIGFGVVTLFGGNFVNGLWLGFIGLFLNNAAAASRQQAEMARRLEGLTVGQLMTRSVQRAPSWVTVGDLYDPFTLSQGQRAFVVEDFGQFRGVLSLKEVVKVPQSRWLQTKVEQVMVPADKLVTLHPETELTTAVQAMQEAGSQQAPVIEGDRVLGMLSMENVYNYLRVKLEMEKGSKDNREPARP